MSRDWAVFIRNNRTPRMAPLRDALEESGLTDVGSFGSSGNLVFGAGPLESVELVALVSEVLGQEVFVRSRLQLSEIVAGDPYYPRPDANTFLFDGALDRTARILREARGSEGLPLVGTVGVVYFVGRPHLPGRGAIVDFERELGVRGTMRSSRVLQRVLEMM